MTSDEDKIRALIGLWEAASNAGDLDTQLTLMTDDVTFLTAGNLPMSREGFIAGFTKMMNLVRLVCRSDIREVTVSGDLAVSWNHLSIEITPYLGGATILRGGDTMTVFRRGADGAWRIWRDANMLSGAG